MSSALEFPLPIVSAQQDMWSSKEKRKSKKWINSKEKICMSMTE